MKLLLYCLNFTHVLQFENVNVFFMSNTGNRSMTEKIWKIIGLSEKFSEFYDWRWLRPSKKDFCRFLYSLTLGF